MSASEWVRYEFGKLPKGYSKLGIKDRAEIEWLEGPHTINGAGAFEFVQKHLRRPVR